MKKKPTILIMIIVFLPFFAGTCLASAPSTDVVIVDADGTSNTEVTFNLIGLSLGDTPTYGYMGSGGFQAFPDQTQFTFDGGNTVDFAIQSGDSVLSVSGGGGVLTFLGTAITPSLAAPVTPMPNWVQKWYNLFKIEWFGGAVTEIGAVDSNQGQSGVAAVPIPATVWIFGAGLVGLVSIRKKLMG